MGAWIETLITRSIFAFFVSHPVWVRGLKQAQISELESDKQSHPVWVRGLKRSG